MPSQPIDRDDTEEGTTLARLTDHVKLVAVILSVAGVLSVPFIYIGKAYVAEAIAAQERAAQDTYVTRDELGSRLTSISEKLTENGKKLDDLASFVSFIRETQVEIKTKVDSLYQ